LPREGAKTRRWAFGVLAAVSILGAMAAAGSVGGKPHVVAWPTDLPADSAQGNRLWIEDITGEGEWIQVESFSWGLSLPTDPSSGSATGRAVFDSLEVSTHFSQFSPDIAEAVATGMHIEKVILEDFATATKKSNETVYLKITLEDCLITSYQVSGQSGGDQLPTESISFNYAKIDFSYVGSDPDLSDSFSYDLQEGRT